VHYPSLAANSSAPSTSSTTATADTFAPPPPPPRYLELVETMKGAPELRRKVRSFLWSFCETSRSLRNLQVQQDLDRTRAMVGQHRLFLLPHLLVLEPIMSFVAHN
jgi:hypothetical protein